MSSIRRDTEAGQKYKTHPRKTKNRRLVKGAFVNCGSYQTFSLQNPIVPRASGLSWIQSFSACFFTYPHPHSTQPMQAS